jgi:hypothetical protein
MSDAGDKSIPSQRHQGSASTKIAFAFDFQKKYRCTLELFQLARARQRPSWFRPGMLAVFENLHAIDENMLHSDGVLVRFVERRPVRNCRRIKDDHIGEHPFLNETAVIEA